MSVKLNPLKCVASLLLLLLMIAGCGTETVSPAYNNIRPEILSLDVSPGDSAEIQDTLGFSVDAIDAENQPLTYKWFAAQGKLLSDTAATARWVSPRTPGAYWISVTVSDPYADTMASVQVNVLPRGATNRPPQIARLTVEPDTVSFGDGVNCAVQATDAEGDPLTYVWSAVDGFFYPESGPQVRWFAPQVGGEYYLRVTVIDSHHFTTDSLPVLVVPDTTFLYVADFSSNQVAGSWGTLGLLAGLGNDEGVNSISWDSTNQAMAVIARPNYGTYAFRLIGRNFGDGTFSCSVKLSNGEFPRVGFVPKLIDRMNYLVVCINPYGGSWQVLRSTAGSLQYLAEGWKVFDLGQPVHFSYTESNDRGTAAINGEMVWQGAVTPEFQRDAPMGVALYGTTFSQAALFDNFRVTNP